MAGASKKLLPSGLRRGWYTNWAGANLKEAQSLARHVDPKLTMNIYARARNDRLAELAEAVGENIKPYVKEVAVKTGTDDQNICAQSVHGKAPAIPSDLEEMSRLWECLPADVRAGMLATARALTQQPLSGPRQAE